MRRVPSLFGSCFFSKIKKRKKKKRLWGRPSKKRFGSHMCNPTQTRPIKPDRLTDSSEGVTLRDRSDTRPHVSGESMKYAARGRNLGGRSTDDTQERSANKLDNRRRHRHRSQTSNAGASPKTAASGMHLLWLEVLARVKLVLWAA